MLKYLNNEFRLIIISLLLILSPINIGYANIIASIRPLAFIATAIADGVTNVEILLPNGFSPHSYSLKPSDLQKIKKNDLFIWIGPNMEVFLKKNLLQLPTQQQIILINNSNIKSHLIKNIDILFNNNKIKTFNQNNNINSYNMHIWLSPDIAFIIAKIIYNKLIKLYPLYIKKLTSNLNNFKYKLKQINIKITKNLSSIQHKKYIVFHDAYSYFEKKYHLNSSGYFTFDPMIQPGVRRLYKIKQMLINKKVSCIFLEPQFRPEVIKAIIKNINVNMGILDPLGNSITLKIDSYIKFLLDLSNKFKNCLDKN